MPAPALCGIACPTVSDDAALLALIAAGITLIFVHVPSGALIYSVFGPVILAGFTMLGSSRYAARPVPPPSPCWPRRSFSTS